MTKVKICGITEPQQALIASEAGADFLGLVFAKSRRQVLPDGALKLTKAIRKFDSHGELVGVFVNVPSQELNAVAAYCQLDLVQISGDEDWNYCREIKFPLIKVIHAGANQNAEDILAEIKIGCNMLKEQEFICMIDAKSEKEYGGTGRSFDWGLAKEITRNHPVIIAGGLTPSNVGILIEEAHPWGVDVSTGVETNGRKDENKIKEFIYAVKGAEGREN
jgi:phosphoribosylanthranilate isomerase